MTTSETQSLAPLGRSRPSGGASLIEHEPGGFVLRRPVPRYFDQLPANERPVVLHDRRIPGGHANWPKFLYELLAKDDEVETAVIQEVARGLAAALPAA